MSIQRVAVCGASGNIGPSIVDQLVHAGFSVTVLSRSAHLSPKLNSAAGFKQVEDFTSKTQVTAALRGHDALVSAVGYSAVSLQSDLIDAAIDAGVKFFMPSEFAAATDNANNAALPINAAKVVVRQHLAARAAEGKIAYALLSTGVFFDWVLPLGLVIDVSGDKPTRVFDGGDVRFSTTLLADVGKAVAGILKNPGEFKNRSVHVNSAVITQNQIITAAKKASVPGKSYPAVQEQLSDAYEQGMAFFTKGEGNPGLARANIFFTALLSPSHGCAFPQEDNKKLGIKLLDEHEVDKLVAGVVRKLQGQ